MAKTKIVMHPKVYNNGNSPILLRVTHQRKPRYFALGIDCTPDQWNRETCRLRRNFTGYKTKNKVIQEYERRGEKIIDRLKEKDQPFTFQTFEKLFLNLPKHTTVFDFLKDRCSELQSEGKINTKGTYTQVLNALKRFENKKDLMFEDIDYKFLKKFESFLFASGCSGGGVHFYMRTLRATINEAIKQGFMKAEHYPFSTQFNKNGYSLKDLKSKASPRALSDADISKIKSFPIDAYPELKQSLNYFLFSYYTRGMNFNDIIKLKWSDVYDNRITYIRSKTGKVLSIGVSDATNKILNQYNGKTARYIFPALDADVHKTEQQIKNRTKKCLKKLNADLKQIADILDINVVLTSYVARHTYAMTLKRNNVNIAVISEGLGHTDINTTRAYLNQFDNTVLDEADQLL